MSDDIIQVDVLGVFPTEQQTLAIFVGNEEKSFVIHVEPVVGRAIAMAMRDEQSERPLTHELIGLIFKALDVSVQRVIINELRSNTYYARIILEEANDVHKNVIEIDARPSDSLAIGIQAKAPLYVSADVWEEVDDRSDEFERIKQALRGKASDEPDFGLDEEDF